MIFIVSGNQGKESNESIHGQREVCPILPDIISQLPDWTNRTAQQEYECDDNQKGQPAPPAKYLATLQREIAERVNRPAHPHPRANQGPPKITICPRGNAFY